MPKLLLALVEAFAVAAGISFIGSTYESLMERPNAGRILAGVGLGYLSALLLVLVEAYIS